MSQYEGVKGAKIKISGLYMYIEHEALSPHPYSVRALHAVSMHAYYMQSGYFLAYGKATTLT